MRFAQKIGSFITLVTPPLPPYNFDALPFGLGCQGCKDHIKQPSRTLSAASGGQIDAPRVRLAAGAPSALLHAPAAAASRPRQARHERESRAGHRRGPGGDLLLPRRRVSTVSPCCCGGAGGRGERWGGRCGVRCKKQQHRNNPRLYSHHAPNAAVITRSNTRDAQTYAHSHQTNAQVQPRHAARAARGDSRAAARDPQLEAERRRAVDHQEVHGQELCRRWAGGRETATPQPRQLMSAVCGVKAANGAAASCR
jgi:hypothetical protein